MKQLRRDHQRMLKGNFYLQGRVARGSGLPRIADPKHAPEDRIAFYKGWDEEDQVRTVRNLTPEQIEKSRELCRKLREFAEQNL